MRIIKGSLKYIAVFLVVLALLMGLLVCTAFLPKSAIKENVRESAEFLCEGELFGEIIEGVEGSKIDRYADSILLGIAYQYDNEHPLTSVMWSSYYHNEFQNENENLLEAVTKDYGPNQQYLRYWHGSNVVVRPLLVFFSIEQIYVLNGILLALLFIWLVVMLWKRKAYVPVVGLVAGLVLTSSWFVPFSLEYTWTYYLMFIMSILCTKLAFSGRWNLLGYCFLIAGMVTNFMDFLTTETLTLLVPLLLVIWIDVNIEKTHAFPIIVKNTVLNICKWGIGYVGMWMMKWGIASVVLKENVMPYVAGHIVERTTGNIGIGVLQYMMKAISTNIKCLFPFEYGDLGALIGFVFLGAVVYVGYVYHKNDILRERVLLYGAIGCVPFVRYLALLNHSYLHDFFTFRALFATILALVMILAEVVEWRWLIHADERKRKS